MKSLLFLMLVVLMAGVAFGGDEVQPALHVCPALNPTKESPGEGKWAAPTPQGVRGTMPWIETFDEEGLSRTKWQFVINRLWDPKDYRVCRIPLPDLLPKPYKDGGVPYPYELDGTSYVGVKEGKLVCYTTCSLYYSTVRTWPVWHRPTDDSKWYAYVWGVAIHKVNIGQERDDHLEEMGFIVGLCDEYNQSTFNDRRKYLAIKGVQKKSTFFRPIPNGGPVDVFKTMRIAGELKYSPTGKDSKLADQDRYVVMPEEPVDLSWEVSKEKLVTRWKRSSETEWRIIGPWNQSRARKLKFLRLEFAGSWCAYTVDAVQVCEEDLVKMKKY